MQKPLRLRKLGSACLIAVLCSSVAAWAKEPPAKKGKNAAAERGRYLVTLGGCNAAPPAAGGSAKM